MNTMNISNMKYLQTKIMRITVHANLTVCERNFELDNVDLNLTKNCLNCETMYVQSSVIGIVETRCGLRASDISSPDSGLVTSVRF